MMVEYYTIYVYSIAYYTHGDVFLYVTVSVVFCILCYYLVPNPSAPLRFERKIL